jgi:hypothetical protein
MFQLQYILRRTDHDHLGVHIIKCVWVPSKGEFVSMGKPTMCECGVEMRDEALLTIHDNMFEFFNTLSGTTDGFRWRFTHDIQQAALAYWTRRYMQSRERRESIVEAVVGELPFVVKKEISDCLAHW